MRYKGLEYDKDEEGLWYVIVEGGKFLVGLDDSKLSGKRKFIDEANNEATCIDFIDYLKGK